MSAREPAPAPASRSARIWRRTRVGGALALGLTSVLVAIERGGGDSRWVMVVCCALLAISLYELDRLGSLASEQLGRLLVPAAIVALALEYPRLEAFARGAPAPSSPYAHASAWFELALASALCGGAAQLVHRLARSGGALARALACALGVAGLALIALSTPLRHALEPARAIAQRSSALMLLGAASLAGLVLLARRERRAGARTQLASVLHAELCAAWLVPPLLLLPRLHASYGMSGLAVLLLLSKVGDIAGYYAGNALGRHHPFPRISPGKTSEGCIASALAGTLVGALCAAAGWLPASRTPWVAGAAAGLALNLAAQAGDLTESWVKRRAGVKDAGSWFGPSGGMLDLIDSVLFSVPMALLVWPLLFESGTPA